MRQKVNSINENGSFYILNKNKFLRNKIRQFGKLGVYEMPKYRSMMVDTPEVATHLLQSPKSALTPIGNFLRKYSIDELPLYYYPVDFNIYERHTKFSPIRYLHLKADLPKWQQFLLGLHYAVLKEHTRLANLKTMHPQHRTSQD